jgi:tRNA nucleotidyltransferase (CCA-adding enzyme)
MAMDIKGNLIDPFKGRVDIITKTIRCVGVPKHRFKEDPLRILRAARFASELGFNIDNLTFSTMEKMSINLLRVSKERWCQELDKILLSDTPSIGLDYLMKCNVFNYILPELSLQYKYNQDSPYHSHDLWTHTKIVVDNAENDLYVRWAALLHDIGKPFLATLNKRGYHNYINHEILGGELVKKIGCYLKRSNEWIDKVTILVLEHMKENSPLKEADNKGK